MSKVDDLEALCKDFREYGAGNRARVAVRLKDLEQVLAIVRLGNKVSCLVMPVNEEASVVLSEFQDALANLEGE